MGNNITELVFILDRSGSMSGFETDTIGGFNGMLSKQKNNDGKCYVTTILFSDDYELIHDRLDISEVPALTADEYYVRGCTALYDAVGKAIRHIAKIHKYSRPEDVPENTVFVITTDGYENSSHRFSGADIKRMITHEKEKYGWEFLFLGADIDAISTAEHIGISRDRSANYRKTGRSNELMYEAVGNAITSARCCEAIAPDWDADLTRDFESSKD